MKTPRYTLHSLVVYTPLNIFFHKISALYTYRVCDILCGMHQPMRFVIKCKPNVNLCTWSIWVSIHICFFFFFTFTYPIEFGCRRGAVDFITICFIPLYFLQLSSLYLCQDQSISRYCLAIAFLSYLVFLYLQ